MNIFDNLPAPFDLIEIPKGIVTVKGKTETIETFHIAKYPVTNAQFAKFIEAKGYQQKKWWTEAGWQQKEKDKWKEPRHWHDDKWNGATQPVVGVSWYEAIAFCNWINAEINLTVGTASMPSAAQIMLPTEQQWQRAAQGDDGRIYPWGKDWDANRCNHNVDGKGSGKTTPVTQYEGKGKGDSYFGVVDMAGNVWEWCRTADESYGTDVRVLRGGSWINNYSYNFRCDDRNGDFPYVRSIIRGFRFALSY